MRCQLCFHQKARPIRHGARRSLLLALLWALALAPAYHAMHRLAHGAVLDHWHAGHAQHPHPHPECNGDSGHHHHHAPTAWLHAFFDGHDDGDCPLLDSLHAPAAAAAVFAVLLPARGLLAPTTAAAVCMRHGRAAGFFDARAPPLAV